jgi:hypothetical protein
VLQQDTGRWTHAGRRKSDLILLLDSADTLDMTYIEFWATRLGVTERLEALRP